MTTFELSMEQLQQFEEWKNAHKWVPTGAVGGRYSFTFTPTGIGTFITITDCITKQTLDVSDVS